MKALHTIFSILVFFSAQNLMAAKFVQKCSAKKSYKNKIVQVCTFKAKHVSKNLKGSDVAIYSLKGKSKWVASGSIAKINAKTQTVTVLLTEFAGKKAKASKNDHIAFDMQGADSQFIAAFSKADTVFK